MAHCTNCGGPVTLGDGPTTCPFCDTVNAPAPREVSVAVPVQIVNTFVQAGANAPAVERRCPHCRKRLVTVRAEDVSLSGCGACGGIWVDNASARSVLSNPLPVFADLARRASAGATGSRGKSEKPTCAECPAVLERSSVHGIELDVCPDHGTWFDGLELDTLVKLLRHEPVTRAGAPAAVVACQGCGQAIASNRANITDAGLRCESCWRAEQAADLARFDADNRTRGGIAVGGVLLGVAAAMLGAGASSRS